MPLPFIRETARNGRWTTSDAKNRLTRIIVGANTVTYVYDGEGKRVKKVAGSAAAYYVGNHYKATNGTALKYYYPSMPQDMLWQAARGNADGYSCNSWQIHRRFVAEL